MPGALRKMWSLVRPGGRLVIVTWGAGAFEPAHTLFLDALHRERPDLAQVNSPRVRLTDPSELGRVFAAAGVTGVEIASEDAGHQLASAEDWWTIVMGTAHRGRVDRLAPDQRDRVRRACLTLTARTLQMPALFALARK